MKIYKITKNTIPTSVMLLHDVALIEWLVEKVLITGSKPIDNSFLK